MKWRTVGECSTGSRREQLCPRQSYDVSFILSVWCLSCSRLPSQSLSLCLYPSLRTQPASRGGYDEAELSPSPHSSPAARGLHIPDDTFADVAIQIGSCALCAPPAPAAPQTKCFLLMIRPGTWFWLLIRST